MKPLSSIPVAVAQINPMMGDIEGNKNIIRNNTLSAILSGARVVVFPEMAISGYPSEDLLFKHGFVEECEKAIKELAKTLSHRITIIVGSPVRINNVLHNCACVLNNKKVYYVTKEALPNYGVFDEKRYFVPGNFSLPSMFTLDGFTIGVSICEDMWVNNANTAKQAAEDISLLINISASPFQQRKRALRQSHALSHVSRHFTPFVYCNLVGGQDELVFDGRSFVIQANTQMTEMAAFSTELRTFDIATKQTKLYGAVKLTSSKTKVNHRDKYHYGPTYPTKARHYENEVEELLDALVLGTRDYATKSGFTDVVIGLSGGIDSAVVACIAKLAGLRVHGVTMPSQYNSQGTIDDAGILASNMGIEFMKIPITTIHESYDLTLHRMARTQLHNVAAENIQARIRGNILMGLSNEKGWLVLTTGNKSETAVGYCTLYGDTAGGFAPIKDVPKTMVFKLAKYIQQLNGWIPTSTITRPPSAELRPDQNDQQSLPPYEELDEIIERYMTANESVREIARAMKISIANVAKIINMIDRAEYKRRQSPPGIKISARAFGRDWRLPLVNKWGSK